MSKLFASKLEKLTEQALRNQRNAAERADFAQECRPNMNDTPADGDCDPGNYKDYNRNPITP